MVKNSRDTRCCLVYLSLTLTHTDTHTHKNAVSYFFGVIVICVGAEIALVDKSISVPLDGHYNGSRERP